VLYFHSILSEDVESQKHGVVVIFAGGEGYAEHLMDEDFIRIIKNLPFRIAVCHATLPDGPKFQFLNKVWFLVLVSKPERVRTKFHRDLSLLETQYDLLTYGIPVHQIPRTNTGNIKIKKHLQWIKTRIAIDQVRETSPDVTSLDCSIIGHPGRHDVLFSRGGNTGYTGNMELHQDVIERMDTFTSNVDRDSRQKVRDEIVACVEARGGRFLELQKGGWWEELSPDEINEKITVSVYSCHKRLCVKEAKVSTASDTSGFLPTNKRQKLGNDRLNCGWFS
jgi:hypothetical protein